MSTHTLHRCVPICECSHPCTQASLWTPISGPKDGGQEPFGRVLVREDWVQGAPLPLAMGIPQFWPLGLGHTHKPPGVRGSGSVPSPDPGSRLCDLGQTLAPLDPHALWATGASLTVTASSPLGSFPHFWQQERLGLDQGWRRAGRGTRCPSVFQGAGPGLA